MDSLRDCKVEFSEPGGACFLFLRLPRGSDDRAMAIGLLEQEAVAVVPGSAFGEAAKGCWRLSFGSLGRGELARAGAGICRFLAGAVN